jgi:hypothetical protein
MRPPKRVGPVALIGVNAIIYTATQPCSLLRISLTNRTAAQIAATVALVPVGIALATVHEILGGQPVPDHDNYQWVGEVPMVAGDTIQALGNGLNCILTIEEKY